MPHSLCAENFVCGVAFALPRRFAPDDVPVTVTVSVPVSASASACACVRVQLVALKKWS